MHDPRVIAAEARAAQYLLPPAEDAWDRSAALERARDALLRASAELFCAGLQAEAGRVHDLHRDLQAAA